MIPLANTQAKISFNYIDKPHIVIPAKSTNQKIESISTLEGVRPSQQKKYVMQQFSSLQLQTRKQLQTSKNLSQPITQSNQKSTKYVLPQAYQSLHKVSQQLDPIPVQNKQKSPILILQAQRGSTSKESIKFKLDDIQQIKESQFLRDAKKQGPKQINYSNNKNIKGQQKINDDTNTAKPNKYNDLVFDGRGKVQSKDDDTSKRNSRQIKTFKIQQIEEKQQSDFAGCCGCGIINKIAFKSKEK